MNKSIIKATITVTDFFTMLRYMKQKIYFAKLLLYYALTISGLTNRDGDYGTVGNQECFESIVEDASSFFREGEGDVF